MTATRSLNYVAFVLLMVTTYFGIQSLWGVLFLFWSLNSFRNGQAFLLYNIARRDDPLLFWLVSMAWLVFGLWMIAADFYPSLLY